MLQQPKPIETNLQPSFHDTIYSLKVLQSALLLCMTTINKNTCNIWKITGAIEEEKIRLRSKSGKETEQGDYKL